MKKPRKLKNEYRVVLPVDVLDYAKGLTEHDLTTTVYAFSEKQALRCVFHRIGWPDLYDKYKPEVDKIVYKTGKQEKPEGAEQLSIGFRKLGRHKETKPKKD